MGELADYLKAEAETIRNQSKRREAALHDWLGAIQRLNEELLSWIKAADDGMGLVEVRTLDTHCREPALGGYSIPGLSISIGDRLSRRSANIIPHARYVAATIKPPGENERRADGMVEIKSDTIADYYLFRLKYERGDEWFIQSVGVWNHQKTYGAVELLTQDRFEEAMLFILK